MHFQHSARLWGDFPALVPGVLYAEGIDRDAEGIDRDVEGIDRDVEVGARADRFAAVAKARLADGPESELPEIQAWRRAFTTMGLKPTQYRCAAESLLRRFGERGPDRGLASLHVRRLGEGADRQGSAPGEQGAPR